jgi:NAD(P)-dependent dehydrogenase (short-subunit alcohol dehydrogenase family)
VTMPAGYSALVTGGTRGIGAAIAERLLKDGNSVIVTGTRAESKPPKDCGFIAVDFQDRSATRSFADKIAGLEIDILINNAGINKISHFAEIDEADFDRIQVVNVHAPFLLCRAVIPGMRARKWGRIVNISSVFGLVSKAARGAYSTSKFALDGMTAALAAEVASDGILANCVSPGFIDTELTRSVLGEKGIAEIIERVPIKRLGKPAEIAALVSWLVSPDNTYLSGQNIAIDGGFTRV